MDQAPSGQGPPCNPLAAPPPPAHAAIPDQVLDESSPPAPPPSPPPQVQFNAQMIRTWSLLHRAAHRLGYIIGGRQEATNLIESPYLMHPIENQTAGLYRTPVATLVRGGGWGVPQGEQGWGVPQGEG